MLIFWLSKLKLVISDIVEDALKQLGSIIREGEREQGRTERKKEGRRKKGKKPKKAGIERKGQNISQAFTALEIQLNITLPCSLKLQFHPPGCNLKSSLCLTFKQ